jgi:tetratricopeptide (TPR) repeat protein
MAAIALFLNQRGLIFGKDTQSPASIQEQKTDASVTREDQSDADQEPGFDSATERDLARQVRVRFATGDYAGAIKLIDEALQRPDASQALKSWLTGQRPVVLASLGWATLAAGDCDRAIEQLRHALAAMGQTSAPSQNDALAGDIRRGLGYCLKKSGLLAGAEENLREALRVKPSDLESRLLLVDLFETDGRFVEAVQFLEDAGPGNEQVSKRLDTMRRRAGEGALQQTLRTPHFNISYRSGEHDALVATAGEILEQGLDELIEKAGYKEPRAPVEVVLYPSNRFNWVLGGIPDWAEGIFDGRMRIPVRAGSRPEVFRAVLRHELVHAMNSSMTGGRPLPPWLEEGLAQRLGEMSAGAAFHFPIKPPGFAPEGDFQHSYLSYGSAAAASIYRQSLYLVLTLERLESDNIRKVIGHLSQSAGTSQDGLLAPAGQTFASLYQRARSWWDERRPLAAR